MMFRWCAISRNDQREFDSLRIPSMRKRNSLFIAVLWLGLAWMPMNVPGQTPPAAAQSSLPPGITISVKATPETASVGDPIRIDLNVSMPAGYRIDVPKPESQLGGFTILDFFPGPAIPDSAIPGKPLMPAPIQAGAEHRHHAQIVAAVYKTGKFAFPSMQLKLRAADGKETLFSSAPVTIEIQSVLKDKDQDLIDLKKQAEIPAPWPWRMLSIIAAAVLILGAALWFFRKRKNKRSEPLSPEQVKSLIDLAEADLRNLLARGLPENGKEKQFYILLSEIVKRILEAGYEIHASERTTSEIMSSLYPKRDLESGKRELIESFLLRCDVVKFAKYIPSRIEHEAASQDALQILMEARKAVGSRQSAVGSLQSAVGSGQPAVDC
jgi:hypothetical protein